MMGKFNVKLIAQGALLLLLGLMLVSKGYVAARYPGVNIPLALLFELPFLVLSVILGEIIINGRSYISKTCAALFFIVGTVLFYIDIGGQYCLFNRLRFDMLGYAALEVDEYLSYLLYYLGTSCGILTIISLLLLALLLRCGLPGKGCQSKRFYIISLSVFLSVSLLFGFVGQLKLVKLQEPNVFHYNIAFGASDYKNNYLPKDWRLDYAEHGREIMDKPNVVVIILESFNAASSRLFSGLGDLTPNLDRIAEGGTYFTNYFANGGASTESRFAILTGKTRINSKLGINAPKFYEHNLIKYLNERGVYTALFTSADDVFNSDKLFGSLPFQYRSKSDDPYYKNSKRMVFNSVPDRDMYNNLLKYLAGRKLPEPYFAMLTTVSTHGPYIHPETGNESYEECVKYADRELGLFFDRLSASGFFENGILVVVSDHHAMIPPSEAERQKYGNEAHHRIPLLLYGRGIAQQMRSERYDHGSMGALLEKLQVGTYELHQYQGQPLGDKSEAVMLVSEYGDNKGWFYLPDGINYQVQFLGDSTEVLGMDKQDGRYKDFLYYIAWLSQEF